MDYIIISAVALSVAALTLFSGFGLGTLLMPAFALFFPVEIAVAATALVHLANNIFKVIFVGGRANWRIVALFAVPAAAFAVAGAWLLGAVARFDVGISYELFGRTCNVTAVKLLIAVLIFGFALAELIPHKAVRAANKGYVAVGGALSGFFGGLSGHQGALRTVFLIRLGLPKEVFVGTIAVSALVVDISRLLVYGATFVASDLEALRAQGIGGLLIAGIAAAFIGSFVGSRVLHKVTMRSIQITVSVMLFLMAAALGSGII